MRSLITAVVFASAIVFAENAEAARCKDQKTAIAYINGVWVSPDDYVVAMETLKDEIKTQLGCDLPLIRTYNTSVSRAADFYESTQLLGNPIEPELAQMII